MKIDFSPVNNYKPNFKASFGDDFLTNVAVGEMAEASPNGTLAIHLALKDIDSNDKLYLTKRNKLYDNQIAVKTFKNNTLRATLLPDTDSHNRLLRELCGESKGLYGYSLDLFDKKAKLSSKDYLAMAQKIIDEQGYNSRKYEKLNLISQIQDKRQEIKTKRAELEQLLSRLQTIQEAERSNNSKLVEKIIFDA